nr:DUF5431 family protein [Klebsiella pneumoniae]
MASYRAICKEIVNHETTAKRPGLVRINRLFNALDIHMPDPEPLM